MSVLEGITVLDFSRGLAGSICTLQLADAGADVIKVEPLSGDPLRQWGAKTGERSALFLTLNRDKRSLAIDYDDPQVYPVLLKMIERADVVVEDFEPSHAQAKKLTYEEFKAVNETLIHCCITPYGQSG
ncbi:MAG: CoA transferase, partial [Anaerolineae bacterium]